MPRNHAAIDIGTNTVRLLVASVDNGQLIRKISVRIAARLGCRIAATGALDKDGITKAVDALQSFRDIIESFNVESITAVGTYALRTASNSSEFIAEVMLKTGISIQIISGEQEAELTLKGISAGCPALKPPYVLIDIGGGSTEWISMKNCISRTSIPIGAVKLHDKFFHSDPPSVEILQEARNHVISLFKNEAALMHAGSTQLVATGGTATTLASIDMSLENYDPDKVHGHVINAATIDNLINTLSGLPVDQRTETKGLEKDRADIIIPGAIILSAIMQLLSAPSVVVSDFGMLEALIIKSDKEEII